MDFNIEIRRKQLENLDQFMGSSRDRVDSILEYLGWSAQKITENQKEMVKCIVNPSSHRIPAASAVTHIQNCAWRKENYAADDLPLSEPNPVPGSTIVIDDMTKINILNGALAKNPLMKTGWRSHEPVPKTSNRLLATFTPDERLALYEYSVAATRGPPEVPEFNTCKPKIEERHNLTADELKAIHRDARRRRIKYKSKCVHTNRKSTTEVLRDVIDSQMVEYEDYLRDEQDGGSIAGLTEYSDRSYSKERRDDSWERDEKRDDYDGEFSKKRRDNYERSYSKDRDEYDDKGYSKREDDKGYRKRDERGYSKREDDKDCRKREDDKGYSRREDGKGYSKREDKGYTKRENYDDKDYNKQADDKNYSKNDEKTNSKRDEKTYSKPEDDKECNKPDNNQDTSGNKKENDRSFNKDDGNLESNKDTIKESVDNHINTMKVHTKGYLKEYSTELRNNFSQPEQQQQQLVINNKKHQAVIDGEVEHESTETASPRSSRSQNSYRSQESRHRGRPRTPTEPSYRERSRSRERGHSRHHRSRRYDDRRRRYDRHRSDR